MAVGLVIGSWAQNHANAATIAEKIQIHSDILKQSRSLTIAKPAGYDTGTDRYPVLYLLDGEENFEYTAVIVRYLAEKERIPEMIVVALDSGDVAHRTHDLTPPSQAEIDNRFLPGNGGADAFLAFIADELVPYVDRTYRTRPYRILVGHSIGGLFAVHTLISKPALFNAHIAIDPTLSWNNGAEIDRAERFFSQAKDLQADVFITAANYFGVVTPGVRRFVAVLDGNRPRGFRWNFKWYDDQTHMSVPLQSIYLGLDTIFDGWHITNPLELFEAGGVEAIHKRFREGAKRYGYERTTPAFTISLLVAALDKTGRLEEAASVLLHDPKNYPPPWNQLDRLARSYAERGNVEQAIRFYRLSLEKNPNNDWAKQKLREMGTNADGHSPRPN
jgi:predicted alpha/beta superfamily hydrolase